MLSYPVRLAPAGERMVMLTFHDLPEAVIVAADEDEAFARAGPVLESVLGGYILEGRSLPAPSQVCGAPTVTTEQFSLLGLEI